MKRLWICFCACALLLSLVGCTRAMPVIKTVEGESCAVPILMYHSVLKDPARTCKFIVTPDRLRQDIAYLLDNGYETVVMQDLTDYVEGIGTLPDKPVVLTFDDGYLNNLTYVLPILEEYDCRAVLSVVGAYTQRFSETPDPNPSYAHVTWLDIRALMLNERFEIQNHSWDMHGQKGRMGSARKKGESDAEYTKVFTADVQRLQTELTNRCGITPKFFTYPFGIIDRLSRSLLKEMGFVGTLTCYESISCVKVGDFASLWGLGRFNRPGDLSTEAFMKKVFGSSDS
ncbi:MAG: polysaccharide deacetylase family protein [Clostridia bacterium]